jgi:hypothetical protein
MLGEDPGLDFSFMKTPSGVLKNDSSGGGDVIND